MNSQNTEIATLTETEVRAIRKAIEADLIGISTFGRNGVPSAEWVAWFLTNDAPRRTPKVIGSILAQRLAPSNGSGEVHG